MIILVILLFFASVVAVFACWICYALNLENKSLLEAEERTNRDFNSAIDRRDEKIADLIHQVEEAESQAREYKQAAFAANERINKQAEMLRQATANLETESQRRAKVQAEYDAYRQQVNAAIERIRGKTA